MQIVIPMTGYGSRFVAAGYKELKPLIPVLGKPLLQWITDGIFPGETDVIFVCRGEHLRTVPRMRERLLAIAPTATVFSVDPWVKKGPVWDVLRAADVIDDEKPTIINYCDVYFTWDWAQMQRRLRARDCDGCVPCYTGFHPHLMVKNNVYASCLTDAQDNLIEIREKYSFAADKTKAKHSAGAYYFRTGRMMKQYCRRLVDSGQTLYGEYYASMVYNFMVRDGLRVWVPADMEHYCQWGTPEDLEESVYWINKMRNITE